MLILKGVNKWCGIRVSISINHAYFVNLGPYMSTTNKATIYLILIYYLFKETLRSATNMIYIKESEILTHEAICEKIKL